MTAWCECCRREIPSPAIRTIAGPFVTGWGMCRRCWTLVGRLTRRGVVWARRAFVAQPLLEESIALYWVWQIAVAEALFCSGRRAAA